MTTSGYFKWDDPTIDELAGYKLPLDWWSRPYEYAWAIQYAKPGMIVADMGCGWMYRPFKDALANVSGHVYAVDADRRLNTQARPPNTEFVIASFTDEVKAIPGGSLDLVFCISVLEDLRDFAGPALKEFRRCINGKGQIILTFDIPFDTDKPTPTYPGLPMVKFEQAMLDAGLRYAGRVDYSKENAVYHDIWNLCCFHAVLEPK